MPTPPADTQREEFVRLLTAAREGSADALGALLMQCRDYLLLVANRSVGPDLQGKVGPSDLVQETFLDAQRDFPRFQGGREDELRAWLCRILVNNRANAGRRYHGTAMRSVEREVPLLADGAANQALPITQDTPTPSGNLMALEQARALQVALAALPEHYRQVLHLRYQEQQTFADIGTALGCSAEAARKLWGRAVNRLQQELHSPDEP